MGLKDLFKKKDDHHYTSLMALMAVALADGKITEEEQMAIAEVCKGWGIKMKDINYLKNHPDKIKPGKNNKLRIFTYKWESVIYSPEEKAAMAKELEDKLSAIAGLITVMAADGEINPRELEICRKFAASCGLDPSIVDKTAQHAIQNNII